MLQVLGNGFGFLGHINIDIFTHLFIEGLGFRGLV